MHSFLKFTALTLCSILAACTAPSKSFIEMAHGPGRAVTGREVPQLSDALALNYSDAAVALLRAKYQGARVTRNVSDVAQLGFAAATGASAAFGYSAKTVAWLGIGATAVPELQRIIDAKGRAQVYQDAVRLIEEAQIEYLSFNQDTASYCLLTQNGVTLLQRTTASIHVVEKTLSGNLPTIEDLRKATEPMSRGGARPTPAGSTPANNIPADPVARPSTEAREAARLTRVERAVNRPNRGPEVVPLSEIERMMEERLLRQKNEDEAKQLGAPGPEEFFAELKSVEPTIPEKERPAFYETIFKNSKIALNAPELDGITTNKGFNGTTLNTAYGKFPQKQVKIHDEFTKLKPKPKPKTSAQSLTVPSEAGQ